MEKRSQMVTIPLEEYKNLLLKERPKDEDKLLLEKIIESLESHLEYNNREYSSDRIIDDIGVDDREKTLKDIFKLIKLLDFERYMKIWNKVQTEERKRKEQEEKMKQMNEAKDLRKEHENDK